MPAEVRTRHPLGPEVVRSMWVLGPLEKQPVLLATELLLQLLLSFVNAISDAGVMPHGLLATAQVQYWFQLDQKVALL